MATATLQPTAATLGPTPPQAGENREAFTVRAHRELMQALPDPNARNRVVWDAWEARFGDSLREHADSHFPPDQFEVRRDVCLWHEHESVGRDSQGNEIVRNNDVSRLSNILTENNLRIEDTDAYAALVDKHTMPAGGRDPDPPKTLGYIGRYRLGMIGRVNPRFALFADEYHRKDRAEVLRDRPRRSVEVLTLKANGRSYIDPVAALSEPPRLPLPAQIYQADEGEEAYRERYEAVEAFPGGSNTYLPGGGRKRGDRDQYSPLEASQPEPERSMSFTSDDVRQIVDAIQSTPQFQFINQLMSQAQMGQAGGGLEGGGEPGADGTPAGPPPAGPAAPAATEMPTDPTPAPGKRETFGGGAQYAVPLVPLAMGAAAGSMANRFGAGSPSDDNPNPGDDEVEREHYAALQAAHEDLSEKYSALAQDNVNLMGEVASLRQGFAEVRAREVDAERKLKLRELHNQFPHFVDLAREESKCLYSAGSQMDDDQFAEHLDDLETYAAKAPPIVGRMVPGGEVPRHQGGIESERYSADLSAKTVDVYTAAINAGQRMTVAEARAKAEEILKAG